MTDPYRLREPFLSPVEQSFYHALNDVLSSQLADKMLSICPKIAISDLVTVTRPNENVHYYNKINRKTIDFLLIHRSNLRPVLAIELDYPKQVHHGNDKFLESVFEAGKLPFVRVTVLENYDRGILAASINDAIEKSIEAITIKSHEDFSPVCPNCGITMVLRFSKAGKGGSKYYGCLNYPDCKETMPASSRHD
jgi:hypothetical protein